MDAQNNVDRLTSNIYTDRVEILASMARPTTVTRCPVQARQTSNHALVRTEDHTHKHIAHKILLDLMKTVCRKTIVVTTFVKDQLGDKKTRDGEISRHNSEMLLLRILRICVDYVSWRLEQAHQCNSNINRSLRKTTHIRTEIARRDSQRICTTRHCDEHIVELENENQLGGTHPRAPKLESRLHAHQRWYFPSSPRLASPSLRIYADRLNMLAMMTAGITTPMLSVPNSSVTQNDECTHQHRKPQTSKAKKNATRHAEDFHICTMWQTHHGQTHTWWHTVLRSNSE